MPNTYDEQLAIPVRICSSCGTGPMPKTFLSGKPPEMREWIARNLDSTSLYPVEVETKIILHDCCLVDYLHEHPATSIQLVSP